MTDYTAQYGEGRYDDSFYGVGIKYLTDSFTMAETMTAVKTYVANLTQSLGVAESFKSEWLKTDPTPVFIYYYTFDRGIPLINVKYDDTPVIGEIDNTIPEINNKWSTTPVISGIFGGSAPIISKSTLYIQ